MAIASVSDVEKLVLADSWMMAVLRAAEQLGLPDWWIGGGFLRNKVWDAIEGRDSGRVRDVDLVYFDPEDVRPETDWTHDEELKRTFPDAEWEVRNQARMHYINGFPPYISVEDGIAHWTETATCVALRLNKGELQFFFAYGTDDLFGVIARPTPYMDTPELLQLVHDRIVRKRWCEKWPRLRIERNKDSL